MSARRSALPTSLRPSVRPSLRRSLRPSFRSFLRPSLRPSLRPTTGRVAGRAALGRAALGLGLALALVTALPALAHPFHTTTLEADWIEAKGELQMALRVDPGAVQAVLATPKNPLVLKPRDGPTPRLQAFVESVVVVRDREGRPVPLLYKGHQVEKTGLFLFFVARLPTGLSKASLTSTAFFDREPKQMNSVVVRAGDRLVRSRVLTPKAPGPLVLP